MVVGLSAAVVMVWSRSFLDDIYMHVFLLLLLVIYLLVCMDKKGFFFFFFFY